MRIHHVVLGSSLFLLAACGAPAQSQGDDAEQATVESPLEATGKVEFYVHAKGQKQGDFKGESTAKGHETDMAAFRFSMEETSPTDSATGQATGKAHLSNVTLTKAFGASDPQWLAALNANEILTTVQFTFVKTSVQGTVQNWQTVKLTNARVVDMQRSTMELDDANKTSMLADQIALTFQKLELTDLTGNTTVVVGQ